MQPKTAVLHTCSVSLMDEAKSPKSIAMGIFPQSWWASDGISRTLEEGETASGVWGDKRQATE